MKSTNSQLQPHFLLQQSLFSSNVHHNILANAQSRKSAGSSSIAYQNASSNSKLMMTNL